MPSRRNSAICFVAAFFVVIPSTRTAADTDSMLCSGKNFALGCLKENFRELYKSNYTRFWDIMYLAERKARKCDSEADSASFLELVRFIGGNAEVGEYFSETVEQLCTTNPRCLLDALTRVDEKVRVEIVNGLRTPLFQEKAAIEKVFRRFKGTKKYKEIMQLYFSR